LRRADRELLRVLTERRLDRESLRDVAERRRRAVSVDVADLVRRDLRIGERVLHAEACALALLGRRRDVERIAAHAEADELRVDLRAACPRVLVFLEREAARA